MHSINQSTFLIRNNDLKYCDGYITVAGDVGLGLFHEAAGSSLNL